MAPAVVSRSQSTYTLIHDACPTVHNGNSRSYTFLTPDILRYAAGYIDDSDEEDNNPTDYIHSLLLSGGAQPSTLTPLITQLSTLIAERIALNPMKKSLEPVRLESTVHMAAQSGIGNTLHLAGSKVDLDSVAGRKVESRVDVKKLEKVMNYKRDMVDYRLNVKFEQNGRKERISLDEQNMNHQNLLKGMIKKHT